MNDSQSCSRAVKASFACALALLTSGCGAEDPSDEASTPAVSLTRPLQYQGHDYLFIRAALPWAQAGALCDSLGYGLVTVDDAQEDAFLRRFYRAWWLGFSDLQIEGRFAWRDGTSSYTNWYPGEPNNHANEDCAVTSPESGKWFDVPCTQLVYVVCESLD